MRKNLRYLILILILLFVAINEAVLDAAEAATGERPAPIERITWLDAMNRFGIDKPDLREADRGRIGLLRRAVGYRDAHCRFGGHCWRQLLGNALFGQLVKHRT